MSSVYVELLHCALVDCRFCAVAPQLLTAPCVPCPVCLYTAHAWRTLVLDPLPTIFDTIVISPYPLMYASISNTAHCLPAVVRSGSPCAGHAVRGMGPVTQCSGAEAWVTGRTARTCPSAHCALQAPACSFDAVMDWRSGCAATAFRFCRPSPYVAAVHVGASSLFTDLRCT